MTKLRVPISEHMRPRELTTRPVNGYRCPAPINYAPPQHKPAKPHIDQLGDLIGSFLYGELMELDEQLIETARTVNDVVDIGNRGAFAELLWQWYLANRAAQVDRALTDITNNLDLGEQSPSFTGDFE